MESLSYTESLYADWAGAGEEMSRVTRYWYLVGANAGVSIGFGKEFCVEFSEGVFVDPV